jgi:type II secretory pathway component GspD/PulD (secretin)
MKTKLLLFLLSLVAAPALTSLAQMILPATAPLPNMPTNAATAPTAPPQSQLTGPSMPATAPLPDMPTNPAVAPTATPQFVGPVLPGTAPNPDMATNTAAASTNTAPEPSLPVLPYPSNPNPPASNAPSSEELMDFAFDDEPLPDAIRQLALLAGLNIQFDHKLDPMTDPVTHAPIAPPTVKEKWKNLTAMQAMQAVLDKYDWQMKRNTNTPVVIISAKEPNAVEPQVFKVILLAYSEPTNIVQEIKLALGDRVVLTPDNRTHQIIVRTTEKEMPSVEHLISQLDSATGQVLIEAKIIETTKDISTAKGIDWTGTLSAQHISFGNGLTAGTTTIASQTGNNLANATTAAASATAPGGRTSTATSGNPLATIVNNSSSFVTTTLGSTAQAGGVSASTAGGFTPHTAFLNADGVSAVLSFLNSDADTKSIAFPRTVSLDGRRTELNVVQNVPVFQQQQSAPAAGASQGLATVLPNYQILVGNTILNEVGVKLTVVPRIAGASNVLLSVQPEISSVDTKIATDTLNGQVNTSPIFDRRSIITEASVPSGYTLVLGGLDDDVMAKTYTKVPGLGDIPGGLGALFRSNTKNHTRDTILIFVTPTIIQTSDFQPTSTDFLRSANEAMPTGTDPAWDRGSPYDWTKPEPFIASPSEP